MAAPVTGRTLPAAAGASSAVAFSAETALEGPQILLRWDSSSILGGGIYVVRKAGAGNASGTAGHPPESIIDGEVIYSLGHAPPVEHYADLTVMPGRFYHYSLFGRPDDAWTLLATAWAWSGEAPHLEESGFETTVRAGATLGPKGTTILLDDVGAFARGGWARIGRARRLIVRVLEVGGPAISFEPVGTFGPPVFTAIRGARVTFVASTGIVRRTVGSWVADGLKVGQRVRIRGALDATGANGAHTVVAVDAQLLRLGTSFAADETTWQTVLTSEPGIVAGEPVWLMNQVATRMQRKLYDLLPPQQRDDDVDEGQAVLLVPAMLGDGSIVNAGKPGVQYARQRYLRAPGALMGRAASGAEALQLLSDAATAPASYLRGFASLYGYTPPADADDARTRALAAMQPQVVRGKGVGAFLRATARAALGQEIAVVAGADRVVRLGELGTGLCSRWEGVPTGVGPQTLIDGYARFVPGALVGWRVQPSTANAATFKIVANTGTQITTLVADGDMSAIAAGVSDTSDPCAFLGASVAAPVTFVSATKKITRGDGTNWVDDGYNVLSEIYVSGAVGAGNSGWHVITAMSGFDLTVGASSLTNEASTVAVVEGGVTDHALCAFTPGWMIGEWVGAMVTPDAADTSGVDGGPRRYRAVWNTAGRIETVGGSMKVTALPGVAYRIAFPYRLIPPLGGRGDPRPSLYTPKSSSVFNERGLMIYASGAADSRATHDLADRVPELLPATTTLHVGADGGGDGSMDVEILAVP